MHNNDAAGLFIYFNKKHYLTHDGYLGGYRIRSFYRKVQTLLSGSQELRHNQWQAQTNQLDQGRKI